MICCSCPDTPDYFDITGLGLTIYKYDQHTGRYTAVDKDLSLTMNKFYFQLSFNQHFYGLHNKYTNPYAAYALTCEDRGHRGTDEKIKSMHIIALSDFNSQHLQGDTLDDLFSIRLYNGVPKISVSELVADTNRIYYKDMTLNVEQKPTSAPIQFRIDMELNTGEKHSVTSKAMNIH